MSLSKKLISLTQQMDSIKANYVELYDFSPCNYFTLNRACGIESVNLAGAALLELDRNLLINKSFLNFVNFHSQLIFKNHIEATLVKKNKARLEIELLKKGNNRCLASIESLCLENNSILITITDITFTRKLESKKIEFEKSLFLLESLFQSSTDAMAVLNLEFQFVMLNDAFVQSFSKIFAFKIKSNMNFLLILADFPQLKDQIILASNKVMIGEETSVLVENDSENDEAYYCYEIYFTPIFEPQLEKHSIGMKIKNITEYNLNQRRQARQQATLNHATRMNAVGEMAAALAHEINQPLAAINIYSHTCLKQFKNDANQNDNFLNALKQIQVLSQHAGEILHRMKNFIREGELCAEKLNLNALITEALNFLDHQRGLKFDIELRLDDNIPLILLDKIKIMQVILNLSQNSIEALQDHKEANLKILINTVFIDDYIEVNFKDNGPGIPKELIGKIMKSYFTTKPQGTGLGLGICRTIIEAHGGRLEIKESREEGAWVRFILPIQPSSTINGSLN